MFANEHFWFAFACTWIQASDIGWISLRRLQLSIIYLWWYELYLLRTWPLSLRIIVFGMHSLWCLYHMLIQSLLAIYHPHVKRRLTRVLMIDKPSCVCYYSVRLMIKRLRIHATSIIWHANQPNSYIVIVDSLVQANSMQGNVPNNLSCNATFITLCSKRIPSYFHHNQRYTH